MRILVVAYSMYKRALKKKYTLLIYIFIPVAAVIIPLLFYSSGDINESITVVDYSQTKSAHLLIDELKNLKGFNISIEDKDKAESSLAGNKISAVVYIPENFYYELKYKYSRYIETSYSQKDEKSYILKSRIEYILSNMHFIAENSRSEEEFIEAYNKWLINKMNVKEEVIFDDEIDERILGFIMIFLIIIYTNSFSTIINDRNDNVYKRVLLTTTSSSEYILGQFLWNMILFIIQSGILVITLKLLKVKIGISISSFYFLLVCIGMISMTLGVFIISLCRQENQISIMSTLIVFPSSMLSGCMWPIEIMGDKMQKLSYIFPQRYIFILYDAIKSADNLYTVICTTSLIILISLLFMTLGLIKMNNSIKE